MNQRWRDRRDSYRPAEPINTRLYEVGPVRHADAKSFVLSHHYSGAYPAAIRRFGLYGPGGTAVFGPSANDAALTNVFDCGARATTGTRGHSVKIALSSRRSPTRSGPPSYDNGT